MHKEIRSPAVTQYTEEKPPTNERQTAGSLLLHTSGVNCISPCIRVYLQQLWWDLSVIYLKFNYILMMFDWNLRETSLKEATITTDVPRTMQGALLAVDGSISCQAASLLGFSAVIYDSCGLMRKPLHQRL